MRYRICGTCKKQRLLKNFSKSKNDKNGLSYLCKTCNALASRKFHLSKKYNITIEQYDSMLKSQDKKCSICENKFNDKSKRFAVDHCHTTGKIRGLLCFHCNTGIGKLKDSVELLEKAIIYLKSHS